jgi:hypothetical protein
MTVSMARLCTCLHTLGAHRLSAINTLTCSVMICECIVFCPRDVD